MQLVALRHEGFREEREWRIVYNPGYHPTAGNLLKESEVKALDGIPQIIHKFPIDVNVSQELAAIDFVAMFDRIILGPSQYLWVMFDAFRKKLETAGVSDAAAKIVTSSISIRT